MLCDRRFVSKKQREKLRVSKKVEDEICAVLRKAVAKVW